MLKLRPWGMESWARNVMLSRRQLEMGYRARRDMYSLWPWKMGYRARGDMHSLWPWKMETSMSRGVEGEDSGTILHIVVRYAPSAPMKTTFTAYPLHPPAQFCPGRPSGR